MGKNCRGAEQDRSAAAAAAKSLQSCPTLCDPIDGSPPGFPIPGTLQARTLAWVAISFSNAWKWKVKVKLLSHVWLFATPRTGFPSPWNSPDQNTGVGSCSLLQRIFPTQGFNPGLPHCRWILYQLSHQGSPKRSLCCCCCWVASVVSGSVQPHRWQPIRLPHPWDSPGKNTGVSSHFLLQCMKVKSESEVTQSCPTPSNPMDCSLPASSIHGIFQARVLKWVVIAFSTVAIRYS